MQESSLKDIIERARAGNLRIITAESLTCGMISSALTEISGASNVINGSFGVYQDEMKSSQLGVPPELLAQFSAVSKPVARSMAAGALLKTGPEALGDKASHISLAVTGYAGSTGGYAPESNAGLVYIAIGTRFDTAANPEVKVYEHRFPGGREEVRAATTDQALEYLHALLLERTS